MNGPNDPAPTTADQDGVDEACAEALLADGVITEDQLAECRRLREQLTVRYPGLRIAHVLLKKGYVERDVLEETLASISGVDESVEEPIRAAGGLVAICDGCEARYDATGRNVGEAAGCPCGGTITVYDEGESPFDSYESYESDYDSDSAPPSEPLPSDDGFAMFRTVEIEPDEIAGAFPGGGPIGPPPGAPEPPGSDVGFEAPSESEPGSDDGSLFEPPPPEAGAGAADIQHRTVEVDEEEIVAGANPMHRTVELESGEIDGSAAMHRTVEVDEHEITADAMDGMRRTVELEPDGAGGWRPEPPAPLPPPALDAEGATVLLGPGSAGQIDESLLAMESGGLVQPEVESGLHAAPTVRGQLESGAWEPEPSGGWEQDAPRGLEENVGGLSETLEAFAPVESSDDAIDGDSSLGGSIDVSDLMGDPDEQTQRTGAPGGSGYGSRPAMMGPGMGAPGGSGIEGSGPVFSDDPDLAPTVEMDGPAGMAGLPVRSETDDHGWDDTRAGSDTGPRSETADSDPPPFEGWGDSESDSDFDATGSGVVVAAKTGGGGAKLAVALVVFVILLGAAGFIGWTMHVSSVVDGSLAAGSDAFRRGDWQAAYDAYRTVVDYQPDHPEASARLVEAEQRLAALRRREERRVASRERDDRANAAIAEASSKAEPSEAAATIDKAILADGESGRLYLERARAARRVGRQKQERGASQDAQARFTGAENDLRIAYDLLKTERAEIDKDIADLAEDDPTAEEDRAMAAVIGQLLAETVLERSFILEFDRGRKREALKEAERVRDESGEPWTVAYADGRAALEERDYKTAGRKLRTVIEARPEAPEPRLLRAQANIGLGRVEKATEDVDAARAEAPLLGRPVALSAWLALVRDDVAAAISESEQAVKLAPRDPLARMIRGQAFEANDQPEKARPEYDFAIEYDPTDAYALFLRGRLRVEREDYYGALPDLNKSLELDESNAEAFFYRGKARHHMQRYDDAYDDYSSAVKLDPTFARAFANRATIRVRREDVAGANGDYDSALALDPENQDLTFNIGLFHYRTRDYQRAIDRVRRAIDLAEDAAAWPNAAQARTVLAASLLNVSPPDPDGAIETLTEAIDIDPAYANSYYYRYQAWERKGELEKALEDLRTYTRYERQPTQVARVQPVIQRLEARIAAAADGGEDPGAGETAGAGEGPDIDQPGVTPARPTPRKRKPIWPPPRG